jgi:hypothetical protein
MDGCKTYGTTICLEMHDAAEEMESRIGPEMVVGSDDMSRAIEPHLRTFQTGRILDPAYSLAIQLARCSYLNRDGYYG